MFSTIIDVPFAVADATTLTEAGYVGDDVDEIEEFYVTDDKKLKKELLKVKRFSFS